MKLPKKLEFYFQTMILSMAQVSLDITISLNDFFPSMCGTRLTSYTISLLINVEFGSIEEWNVLSYFFSQEFYLCLSVKFVTDGHTVGRKWFTGCGDLASWIFFMEISILITSAIGWVLVAMITTLH